MKTFGSLLIRTRDSAHTAIVLGSAEAEEFANRTIPIINTQFGKRYLGYAEAARVLPPEQQQRFVRDVMRAARDAGLDGPGAHLMVERDPLAHQQNTGDSEGLRAINDRHARWRRSMNEVHTKFWADRGQ